MSVQQPQGGRILHFDTKPNKKHKKRRKENATKEQIMQVDFDLFNLKDQDAPTVRMLLHALLSPIEVPAFKTEATVSLLTDQLIQNNLEWPGSVIKTDGEDSEPISLLALYPMAEGPLKGLLGTLPPLEELQGLVEEKMRSKGIKFKQSAKRSPKIGWILKCHMMINTPSALAGPLYQLLLRELDETESSTDLFIIVVRTRQAVDEDKESAGKHLSVFPEDRLLGKFGACPVDLPVRAPLVPPQAKRLFSKRGFIEGRRIWVMSRELLIAYVKALDAFTE